MARRSGMNIQLDGAAKVPFMAIAMVIETPILVGAPGAPGFLW